jgi:hypothetical protein
MSPREWESWILAGEVEVPIAAVGRLPVMYMADRRPARAGVQNQAYGPTHPLP